MSPITHLNIASSSPITVADVSADRETLENFRSMARLEDAVEEIEVLVQIAIHRGPTSPPQSAILRTECPESLLASEVLEVVNHMMAEPHTVLEEVHGLFHLAVSQRGLAESWLVGTSATPLHVQEGRYWEHPGFQVLGSLPQVFLEDSPASHTPLALDKHPERVLAATVRHRMPLLVDEDNNEHSIATLYLIHKSVLEQE